MKNKIKSIKENWPIYLATASLALVPAILGPIGIYNAKQGFDADLAQSRAPAAEPYTPKIENNRIQIGHESNLGNYTIE